MQNPQTTPYSAPMYCKGIATRDGEPFRCAIADETAAAKATCLDKVLAKKLVLDRCVLYNYTIFR